jgi:hypothetical protein
MSGTCHDYRFLYGVIFLNIPDRHSPYMDTLAGGTTPSRRTTFAKCSAAWRQAGVFHSVRQHGITVYHQLGHVA